MGGGAFASLLTIACSDGDAGATPSGTSAGEGSGAATTGAAGDEATTAAPEPDAGVPWAPWNEGKPIPPGDPITGDPEAGRAALLERGYVSCGIPWSVFPLVKALLGGFASEPPLPGRTGNNASVPYNWTVWDNADGVAIASLNCLECHAGRWQGEVMVGLGRADADYTQDFGALLGGLDVPQLNVPGIESLTRFMQRYTVLGPAIQMKTIGTNPADEVAVVLAAHRDRDTLAWSDTPHTPVPDLVAPVDTPPWWRTKKKNGLFYNGMARGDHRGSMMFASSLCTDTVEEAQEILAYFEDIRAYIATMEAPVYPLSIDAALAAEGAKVFADTCAGCHGTYADSDELDSYPNLLFELDVIGTDPLVASYAASSPLIEWFNGSVYGGVTTLSPDDPGIGYVAPPLDGIWATAPFFHNGSVPTIELVLDSTARPQRWKRVDYDSSHFDADAIGWPWVEVPYGWDEAPVDERKHIYDTTLDGHHATGHDFGDHLDADERRAVLEYLKTL
ncbi:MAG: hypothetical protein K1X88_35430 [Nannocystaceae bacterium]|nr:hypothetical protein [Nannocystaceae bacterium]